jgi:light-regulated signal transduction histidine kinase (bacteriophytochrome)
MDRLIEELLSYTRIENQAASYQCVDCEKVFEQALADLHAAISITDAEITCDPLPTIHANATQMAQLFQNLIDNAIKYSAADPPKVHVSATRQETDWEFSVRDNGIGIDMKYLNKVFDVFRRLHSDDVFPGTGIGLAICKAIVERHGGRIWVESVKSEGSTSYFAIPAKVCV